MILVTGGAGYIGSHVVLDLIKKKYELVVFDNLSQGNRDLLVPEILSESHLFIGDLLYPKKIEEVFKKFSIEAVMHFAALASVPESVKKPDLYHKNNVVGTKNLLYTMRKFRVNKLIFSSTAAVYGNAKETPITENHPCQPINPYGETKLTIERELEQLSKKENFQYIALRYFNAAGADPEGKIGEKHKNEHHLIPKILQGILQAKKERRKPKADIYGKNHPTKDGTCVRDYIHVSDLAKAHILAFECLENKKRSSIYNLGTENGNSVLEIIEIASQITGEKVDFDFKAPRPGDPAVLVASSKRIRKELGWEPQFTNIRDIIQTAWIWEKSQMD